VSRPNKRAARFGDRYRIPGGEDYLPVGFNIRRFSKAVQDAMPAIRRMTASLRVVAENMRQAREMEDTTRQVEAIFRSDDAARSAVWFAPVGTAAPTLAELEAGTPIHVTLTTGETFDGRLAGPTYDTRYARSSGPIAWADGGTVTWDNGIYLTTMPLDRIDSRPDPPADILDRIDDTLNSYEDTYDMQGREFAPSDEPWPYRGF
jgi:hypothetical protein